MTISLKHTDEIFFSVHFLMPLGIPFHENMVSYRSIFFYFLASQTHREKSLICIKVEYDTCAIIASVKKTIALEKETMFVSNSITYVTCFDLMF